MTTDELPETVARGDACALCYKRGLFGLPLAWGFWRPIKLQDGTVLLAHRSCAQSYQTASLTCRMLLHEFEGDTDLAALVEAVRELRRP